MIKNGSYSYRPIETYWILVIMMDVELGYSRSTRRRGILFNSDSFKSKATTRAKARQPFGV